MHHFSWGLNRSWLHGNRFIPEICWEPGFSTEAGEVRSFQSSLESAGAALLTSPGVRNGFVTVKDSQNLTENSHSLEHLYANSEITCADLGRDAMVEREKQVSNDGLAKRPNILENQNCERCIVGRPCGVK